MWIYLTVDWGSVWKMEIVNVDEGIKDQGMLGVQLVMIPATCVGEVTCQ